MKDFRENANRFGMAGLQIKVSRDDACPCCGERVDEYNDLEFTDDGIWVGYNCPSCHSAWNTFYRLDYQHVMYDGSC